MSKNWTTWAAFLLLWASPVGSRAEPQQPSRKGISGIFWAKGMCSVAAILVLFVAAKMFLWIRRDISSAYITWGDLLTRVVHRVKPCGQDTSFDTSFGDISPTPYHSHTPGNECCGQLFSQAILLSLIQSSDKTMVNTAHCHRNLLFGHLMLKSNGSWIKLALNSKICQKEQNKILPIPIPTTILTCAQKRTSSQLSLPHGTVKLKNKWKLKRKTVEQNKTETARNQSGWWAWVSMEEKICL